MTYDIVATTVDNVFKCNALFFVTLQFISIKKFLRHPIGYIILKVFASET